MLGAHLSWDFAATLRRMLMETDPTSTLDLLILSRDAKVLLGGEFGATQLNPAPAQTASVNAERHIHRNIRRSANADRLLPQLNPAANIRALAGSS